MATYRMFQQKPEAVWSWYLYRLEVCRQAAPNAGHLALKEMEDLLKDRFSLITQNVDGLHLRAGNSLERTYQIHGNIFYMRCAEDCTEQPNPIPSALYGRKKDDAIGAAEKELLRCTQCGRWSRPHVLWFDVTYNEIYYKYQSALAIAEKTELLIIVGTSGTTNLPTQVAWLASRNNAILLNIDIERNFFTNLAEGSRQGMFLQWTSETVIPRIVNLMKEALKG
jgi:NAD-dependent deacetylase